MVTHFVDELFDLDFRGGNAIFVGRETGERWAVPLDRFWANKAIIDRKAEEFLRAHEVVALRGDHAASS